MKSITFSTKQAELREEDGKNIIKVPISSTSIDRDEEKINKEGLEAITSQIVEENVPMFPNHGMGDSDAFYGFEDIMGRWFNAEIDEDTVVAEAELRDGNRYADELVDLMSQDMPVGFSIGFGYDEEDVKSEDGDTNVYTDMDLVEISPVGIPSNPDARVSFAQAVAKELDDKNVDLKQAVDSVKKAIKDLSEGEKDEDGKEPDEDTPKEENTEKEKSEMELFVDACDQIAETLDVKIIEIFKLFVGKPFGPWEDFDDCVASMMEEQGYDEETAQAVCAELQEELEGEGEDDDEEDEEETDSKMKQVLLDVKQENDELKEEIEELKRDLKKTKAKNRKSNRKGITPAEKDTEDPNEPEERTYPDLTTEVEQS